MASNKKNHSNSRPYIADIPGLYSNPNDLDSECPCRQNRSFSEAESIDICTCSDSRILDIFPIQRYQYYASVNLQCKGLGSVVGCVGSDVNIEYRWTLRAISGNVGLVGPIVKATEPTVVVGGSGTFDLTVEVTFVCRQFIPGPVAVWVPIECKQSLTRRFTQQ
ncbi:hypothetical protein PH210_06030 [Paenibacillus sp. BSR1-1]|uniref:hypothetical protein n=1 Tax=Paenibacillus sp. BSR1-1 TaxID=3020845 RepID=UPI0025B0FE75|nr:hypothetical protein [Paenibacillus sp. BSR1-1]MDN3015764.1 hypothetical protein [Paenibacillus sp. BSR1-1]